MQEILQGNAALIEALGALCTRDKAIHHSTDAYGNAFHWFRLDHPRFMSQAATALQGAHARLCMITAYNLKQLGEQQQELCYHFELQGVVYNILTFCASPASFPIGHHLRGSVFNRKRPLLEQIYFLQQI